MPEKQTKGETHGCIVCGKLYQVYAVYDGNQHFVDAMVMSDGARLVPHDRRPLVACNLHTDNQVERAIVRVFGKDADQE